MSEEKGKTMLLPDDKEEYIPIEAGFEILYSVLHPNYGRSMFTFCPIIKDGIIKEVYIEATPQTRDIKRWKLVLPEGAEWNMLTFSSSIGVQKYCMWRSIWCDVHKVMAYQCYAPDKTGVINIRLALGNWIDFGFDEYKNE